MSFWTHICGAFEAYTCADTNWDAMFRIEEAIHHAPRVEGSEGWLKMHARLAEGYSSSSNVDEFWQPSNLYTTSKFYGFETQETVIVDCVGHLRDTTFEGTLRQLTKALVRIGKDVAIRNCCIAVWDSYGKSTVILDSYGWLHDLFRMDREERCRASEDE